MQDKRAERRHPFAITQKLAPIVDGKMPGLDEFLPARLDNLSRAGFAFHSSTKLDFSELVVALGITSQPLYLTARIVHTTPVDKDGKTVVCAGCRFTGRAQWSEQTQTFLRKGDIESVFELLTSEGRA